jgi:mono/diheme cytochrome c family protein
VDSKVNFFHFVNERFGSRCSREVRVRSKALGWFLAFCVSAAAAQDGAAIRRGEALVNRDCSRCHATARTGQSTHPEAPLFRTLGKRYPIKALEEALGEGIISGHPDMPEFRFESNEVGAIIAYLNSIQER